MKELRKQIINASNYKEDNKWVLQTPKQIRDDALRDLIKAYKSNFAKKKKNVDHRFELKYKSKKAPQDSVQIQKQSWTGAGRIFPSKEFMNDTIIRSSQNRRKRKINNDCKNIRQERNSCPDELPTDTRLVRTKSGKFYLCLVKPLSFVDQKHIPRIMEKNSIIALDPGDRTFITGFTNSGQILEVGRADKQRIIRLGCHLDQLQSQYSNKDLCHRNRYHMKKAAQRVRDKIRNLVDDLHCKLVKHLVHSYATILLPTFQTSKMVQKNHRSISSQTVRSMMTWSHYRFQQRLIHKIREAYWCRVMLVDEAYTSITCGKCGFIRSKNKSKEFSCPQCHFEADRDIQAARNILLRFITLHSSVNSNGLTLGVHPFLNYDTIQPKTCYDSLILDKSNHKRL